MQTGAITYASAQSFVTLERAYVTVYSQPKQPIPNRQPQYLKCGLAGDKTPRAVIPAIVGRPIINLHEQASDQAIKARPQPRPTHIHPPAPQERYIADECLAAKERLHCSYPVTNGIVTEWDDMVAIWEHAFSTRLGITPADCRVLLTDPPLNPTANRTRMLEIMFEHFGFEGAFIQIQAVLTLYSQGGFRGHCGYCTDTFCGGITTQACCAWMCVSVSTCLAQMFVATFQTNMQLSSSILCHLFLIIIGPSR